MDVVCKLGALEFRLMRVEHQPLPELESRPFLLLPDGTEVRRTTGSASPCLVVDHRHDFEGLARIEYWESVGAQEGPTGMLMTVCDALVQPY